MFYPEDYPETYFYSKKLSKLQMFKGIRQEKGAGEFPR